MLNDLFALEDGNLNIDLASLGLVETADGEAIAAAFLEYLTTLNLDNLQAVRQYQGEFFRFERLQVGTVYVVRARLSSPSDSPNLIL